MGNVSQDIAQLKRQVGKLPEELTVGIWEYLEDIWVEEGPLVVQTTNLLGGAGIYGHVGFGIYGTSRYATNEGMIWGHAVHSIWGSAEWGPFSVGFVLGSPILGVLGTNKLGTGNQATNTIRVVNTDNVFRERFRDDDFEHTNTTATWDTTNHLCYFGDSEVMKTEIVALNEETYTTGKVIITGAALSNLTLELQFDGSTWETVSNNVSFTSTNGSTKGIKFRATAGTAHSNKFALAFPVSFAGTTIEVLKIEYS